MSRPGTKWRDIHFDVLKAVDQTGSVMLHEVRIPTMLFLGLEPWAVEVSVWLEFGEVRRD